MSSDDRQEIELTNLPTHWSWALLNDLVADEPNALADGPFGSNLKSIDYTEQGCRVVRLGNIGIGHFVDDDKAFISIEKSETLSRHRIYPGDLVIAALADPVGRCAQIPDGLGPAIVKADCVRAKIRSQILPRYVMYALNSRDGLRRAEAMSHGIGRLRINMANMRDLPVPLAPLNEQRRIVRKIEALFERSRRARQALDAIPPLIERLRQSILTAAFRGDLTADWRAKNPDVEPAERLLERIRAERRLRWQQAYLDKLKAKGQAPRDDRWQEKYEEPEPADSADLPELPRGWCWASLDELAIDGPSNGFSPNCSDQGHGPIVLKLSATTSGKVILTPETTKRSLENIPDDARCWLEPGDLLIQRSNTIEYVGTAALYRGPAHKYVFPDLMMRVRMPRESFAHIAWHYMNSQAGRTYLRERATGTAGNMPKINGSTLRAMPIPLPPEDEQLALQEAVQRALDLTEQISAPLAESVLRRAQLEHAILAKAFRGELVPQDPNDEPASVLLERIRAARQDTPSTKRGRRARSSESSDTPPAASRDEAPPEPKAAARAKPEQPAPARASARPKPEPARPEPEPAQTSLPFGLAEQDPEIVQDAIYAALWGRGPLEVDAAVRTVADALRDRGLVQYQRLRSDGPLYADIKKAIDTAVRAGWLDRPRRGHVRAVESDAREYTTDDWRVALLAALDGDGQPVDRDEAITRAAAWARDNMGLEFQRLRTGGVIESGIKSAINSAIRRGELERIDATRIQRRS